jgi:hypothetical protein
MAGSRSDGKHPQAKDAGRYDDGGSLPKRSKGTISEQDQLGRITVDDDAGFERTCYANSLYLPLPHADLRGGCRARTRNYDEELKQEQLAKARTQIGTQVLQDSDLAKVVTAWPTLPPALKAAILAVVTSAKT